MAARTPDDVHARERRQEHDGASLDSGVAWHESCDRVDKSAGARLCFRAQAFAPPCARTHVGTRASGRVLSPPEWPHIDECAGDIALAAESPVALVRSVFRSNRHSQHRGLRSRFPRKGEGSVALTLLVSGAERLLPRRVTWCLLRLDRRRREAVADRSLLGRVEFVREYPLDREHGDLDLRLNARVFRSGLL